MPALAASRTSAATVTRGRARSATSASRTATRTCHLIKLDVCGDGKVGPTEGCDDGNKIGLDGCSAFCVPEVKCAGKIYQCGNGIDDDGDGKIDSRTPSTPPCDDSEKSYQTNLPGQNRLQVRLLLGRQQRRRRRQGEWNLKCDKLNPGASVGCVLYDPAYKMCSLMMPPQCLNFCVPLVSTAATASAAARSGRSSTT